MSVFTTKSRDNAAPAAAQNFGTQNGKRGVFSVLGADVTITGNIAASADLHIEGRVQGDVACANLVQGADSVIVGNVKADSARVAGKVDGVVSVRQLSVERSARITGDVEYENIAVENGAGIDGRMKRMTGATAHIETVQLIATSDAA